MLSRGSNVHCSKGEVATVQRNRLLVRRPGLLAISCSVRSIGGPQSAIEILDVDLDQELRVDPVAAIGELHDVERRNVEECPAQAADRYLQPVAGDSHRDVAPELLQELVPGAGMLPFEKQITQDGRTPLSVP